jgi:hypothetical protein
MIKDLYSIIKSNLIFIETLFHLKDNYQIQNINSTKRIIIKTTPSYHIYEYIPILKDFLKDEYNFISYLITETFENDIIKYEIKLNYNPLFNNYDVFYKLSFFIYISNENGKINFYLKTNDINDPNPMIFIIKNYLDNQHMNYVKNDILEKEIRPLLSSFNPHSFELNIV